MTIIEETPNQNFRDAWTYVDRNYAYLIRESHLRSVSLLDDHCPGTDGLHIWHPLHGFADITVRNARGYDTAHYVEVLVHELTHLVQCSSGRAAAGLTEQEMEDEAYPAGRNAKQLYQLREVEACASAMQAAQIARTAKRFRGA